MDVLLGQLGGSLSQNQVSDVTYALLVQLTKHHHLIQPVQHFRPEVGLHNHLRSNGQTEWQFLVTDSNAGSHERVTVNTKYILTRHGQNTLLTLLYHKVNQACCCHLVASPAVSNMTAVWMYGWTSMLLSRQVTYLELICDKGVQALVLIILC